MYICTSIFFVLLTYIYIYIYIYVCFLLGNGYHIQGPITSGPGRWAPIIRVGVDTNSQQCKGNVSLWVVSA